MPDQTLTFVPETVLKRDIFSETIRGHLVEDPSRRVVLRKLDGVPWYARPVAWVLARKEIRGLRAVQGVEGTPDLLRVDRVGLLRGWSEGTPLQLARPGDPAFYRDAKRLLRQMRRRGVTHNDIAKPQNWLMTPEGRAAVIDFQLASVHRRQGVLFRTMAREDLRHLLKQKRAYAPELLTATERRMLARKSLPSRLWMATAKPVYNFVTRRLMNWSDGEGTDDRIARAEQPERAFHIRAPDARDIAADDHDGASRQEVELTLHSGAEIARPLRDDDQIQTADRQRADMGVIGRHGKDGSPARRSQFLYLSCKIGPIEPQRLGRANGSGEPRLDPPHHRLAGHDDE